jgi:hypothetical protein
MKVRAFLIELTNIDWMCHWWVLAVDKMYCGLSSDTEVDCHVMWNVLTLHDNTLVLIFWEEFQIHWVHTLLIRQQTVCVWIVKGGIVDYLEFLDVYTGMSCFTPGLCSWKMLCKLNTVFPFKTVCSQAFRGLTASSGIVYDSHSVSRSSFRNCIHVMKIVSFCEPTKPTCTCILV